MRIRSCFDTHLAALKFEEVLDLLAELRRLHFELVVHLAVIKEVRQILDFDLHLDSRFSEVSFDNRE